MSRVSSRKLGLKVAFPALNEVRLFPRSTALNGVSRSETATSASAAAADPSQQPQEGSSSSGSSKNSEIPHFAHVLSWARELFPILRSSRFVFVYTDEEGDEISFDTADEFATAWEIALREKRKSLRLSVRVTGPAASPAVDAPPAALGLSTAEPHAASAGATVDREIATRGSQTDPTSARLSSESIVGVSTHSNGNRKSSRPHRVSPSQSCLKSADLEQALRAVDAPSKDELMMFITAFNSQVKRDVSPLEALDSLLVPTDTTAPQLDRSGWSSASLDQSGCSNCPSASTVMVGTLSRGSAIGRLLATALESARPDFANIVIARAVVELVDLIPVVFPSSSLMLHSISATKAKALPVLDAHSSVSLDALATNPTRRPTSTEPRFGSATMNSRARVATLPELGARVVSHPSIPPGFVFPWDAQLEATKPVELEKSWVIANSGSKAWPKGVHMTLVAGDEALLARPLAHLPSLEPGMEIQCGAHVSISVRNDPARHFSLLLRLQTADGRLFGEPLVVDITLATKSAVSPGSRVSDLTLPKPKDAPIASPVKPRQQKRPQASSGRRSAPVATSPSPSSPAADATSLSPFPVSTNLSPPGADASASTSLSNVGTSRQAATQSLLSQLESMGFKNTKTNLFYLHKFDWDLQRAVTALVAEQSGDSG